MIVSSETRVKHYNIECTFCGHVFYVREEEDILNTGRENDMICPYCGTAMRSSSSVNYLTSMLDDK